MQSVADNVHDFEPEVTGPTTADDCKGGGWATYDSPTFRNQGQCVSSIQSAGHRPQRG